MKRKTFLALEIIGPLIMVISTIVWKLMIRNMILWQAIIDTSMVTFITWLVFNSIIYFNFSKIVDETSHTET